MDDLDPELKYLFETVGITSKELQDNETSAFIYDFIEKHGGVDALKRSHRETLQASNSAAAPAPLPPRTRRSSDGKYR